MRQYDELTAAEQEKAVDKELGSLLGYVIEGSVRFDDEANGDNLQAAIDTAGEEANANQTPWFASEYIMEAEYSDAPGLAVAVGLAEPQTVGATLRGMAQCSAEDALYPGPDEHVIRL